jgi:hypothetical protein
MRRCGVWMSNFLPSLTFPNFHHKSFLKKANLRRGGDYGRRRRAEEEQKCDIKKLWPKRD